VVILQRFFLLGIVVTHSTGLLLISEALKRRWQSTVHVVDLSEIYAKRSRNPTARPSYYASITRDLSPDDFLTGLITRYYVCIYDRNSKPVNSLDRTFTMTKWGAAAWAKRWIKRQQKGKKIFYIDLDA
jgi:hypothetical protein